MRVLLLSWEYPPRLHGGLGRHVHALSRELASAGHEVHVLTTEHVAAPDRTIVEGVCVHRVRTVPGGPWPASDWPDEPWLEQVRDVNAALSTGAARLAGAHRFDLVHAHDWMVGAATATLIERTGLPLVVTVHATERGRHQGWLPGPLQRWVDTRERLLARSADEVIVCSRSMSIQVTEHLGVPHLTVVPNGVDTAPSADGRSLLPRPSGDDAQVLFVGRLEHEKGLHVLLEAIALLRAEGRSTRLAVTGDGTQRAKLEERADGLGLGRCTVFHGFGDAAALAMAHAASAVAVVPSLYEPFGLVALEAMAAGTPVIASRTGGLAEVVEHGRSGLLVDPADPQRLAQAIGLVLDDDGLSALLRHEGRQQALRSTWSVAARLTADVYRRVSAG